MQQLTDILYGVSLEETRGDVKVFASKIVFDSRKVQEGDVFVAVRGTQADGHRYVWDAVEKGAVAVVVEEFPAHDYPDITFCKVPDTAIALGIMAANFYGHPSKKLQLVGITGTNGKTTVATLLHRLYLGLGFKSGLLSTVENKIHHQTVAATHTTPDPVRLNEMLAEMVATGCEYCFMEVSSHAIVQQRVRGLHFTGGIFTNISHDHLDYHKTFEEYIKAKKQFFNGLTKGAFALINLDDKRGNVMLQNTQAKKRSFSLRGMGDYNARVLENSFSGLVLNLDGLELHTRIIGEFNASNLLAVYATAMELDADKMEVMQVLSSLAPAEGRFEYVHSPGQQIIGIVDYAHTPDALKNVLHTVQAVRSGLGTLITVIGCGGDRDKDKRPVMGRVAAELSDKVILTSDNPRSEKPEAIIEDMKKGILPPLDKKLLTITSRRDAIQTACMMAAQGDIILVAGKGHEKYQEINGERAHFDDKEELAKAFKSMGK